MYSMDHKACNHLDELILMVWQHYIGDKMKAGN